MQQMISPPRHGTMINPRASVAGIDAANGQCWYEIRALAAGRVEIFLYDVIGGWGITAQQFVSDCKEAGVFEASAVDLHIHSPGGDVMQGFAIFNTLSRLKAKLDIWVDGVAASMASMIVRLPGATVHMPENAWLMVHKPWGGIAGDSDDMRDYAAWLDRNEALMLSAYMNKTGLGQEELEAMLKAETWLNGAEAVEKGFADTLEPELQAAACVNQNKLKDYQNMPEQMKNLFGPRAEAPASQPQPAQNPAPQAANNPPAQQPAQQPLAGNIDITALAAQLQQQMQAANTERVSAVSAVFDAFPAFGSLKAECITDISCSAEQARTKLLNALAAGTTPSAGPGAVHIHAGNGNIVGDSIRAAVMNRAGYAQAEKDNLRLADIVKTVATDNGLIPRVADALKDIRINHIDQVAESDANLLARLARDYNAVSKPSGGYWLFLQQGATATASGKQTGGITITPDEVSNWSYSEGERGSSTGKATGSGGKAKEKIGVRYYDEEDGTTKTSSVEHDGPAMTNPYTQSEKNTAEQQAKSRKTQAKRNEQKMTLTGPCRPKHVPLTAEASVSTSGFGSREDRTWVVESLVFSLTSAGFSYTYNLVVDIRKPAAASKKSEKQDKKGPSYFG